MVKLIYHKNFKKLLNFVQKDYYFLISNHKYDVRSNGYQPLFWSRINPSLLLF